jgi:hypothetical protein
MGWVVNATPRPLYPRERPGTHCIGGWVDPTAGLDGCRKSRPHRDFRVPDRLAPRESLFRLSYSGPRETKLKFYIAKLILDRYEHIRNNALHDLVLIKLTVISFVGIRGFLIRRSDGHTKLTHRQLKKWDYF